MEVLDLAIPFVVFFLVLNKYSISTRYFKYNWNEFVR